MILHIPHAGTNTLGRYIEQFDIDYLTDWRTDELFYHSNSDRLIQKVSRFVCDVERFTDDKEPMYSQGQGICYTKGTRDNDIEVIDKEGILKIYDKWHLDLILLMNQTLCYFSKIVLVDCHSFPDKEGYPDFCIGTTEQTPKELVDLVQDFLIDYDVKVNYPYCGSMIPAKFVGNPDVFPIMIEVNKKLYLNNEDD
ncbi:MAG: hypothetical protein RIQ94_2140, partial [Pseudomonadota bacterium]